MGNEPVDILRDSDERILGIKTHSHMSFDDISRSMFHIEARTISIRKEDSKFPIVYHPLSIDLIHFRDDFFSLILEGSRYHTKLMSICPSWIILPRLTREHDV